MVHQRQRLSLGFESSDYLTRVHPEPDHFERHLPVDRFVLLGQIDHSPSALAELAQQFVAADSGPQSVLRAQINGVSLFWMVQKTSGRLVGLDQFLNFSAQRFDPAARPLQESPALR